MYAKKSLAGSLFLNLEFLDCWHYCSYTRDQDTVFSKKALETVLQYSLEIITGTVQISVCLNFHLKLFYRITFLFVKLSLHFDWIAVDCGFLLTFAEPLILFTLLTSDLSTTSVPWPITHTHMTCFNYFSTCVICVEMYILLWK